MPTTTNKLTSFYSMADELLTLPDDDKVIRLIEGQEENHWTATAVDYEDDYKTFNKLPIYVQELVLNILMFTLVGDEVIMEETEDILSSHLTLSEKNYMARKQANEAVHAESYVNMARALEGIDGLKERYRALFEIDQIFDKLNWLNVTLAEYREFKFMVLAAFCLAEGVYFRGVFIVADFVRAYYGWAIPGFVSTNEYIRADENKHTYSLAILAEGCKRPEGYEDIIKQMTSTVAKTEFDVLKICHERALEKSIRSGEEQDFVLLDVEGCRGFPVVLGEEIMESLGVEHEKSGLKVPNWAKGLTSERTSFYESETTHYSKIKMGKVENLWWEEELLRKLEVC